MAQLDETDPGATLTAHPGNLQQTIDAASEGDLILLEDGVYDQVGYVQQSRNQSFVAAIKTNRLTIQAINPGKVKFQGGVPADGWTVQEGNIHVGVLRDSYDADKILSFRSWDVDGNAKMSALFKSEDAYYDREKHAGWQVPSSFDATTLSSPLLDGMNLTGATLLMHGIDNNLYPNMITDHQGDTVTIDGDISAFKADDHFNVINHPDLISTPGEYAVDLEMGLVYYQPLGDPESFRAPGIWGGITCIGDATGVTVSGIDFGYFLGRGIGRISGSQSDWTIQQCNFTDVLSGISMHGQGLTLRDLSVTRTGSRGISIGDGSGVLVERVEVSVTTSTGCWLGGVDGFRITELYAHDVYGTHSNGAALYMTPNGGCRNGIVENSTFVDNKIGFAVNGQLGGLVFRNNVFHRTDGQDKIGLTVRGGSDQEPVTVVHNVFHDSSLGVSPEGSVITNNVLSTYNEMRHDGQGITRRNNVYIETGWVMNSDPSLLGPGSQIADIEDVLPDHAHGNWYTSAPYQQMGLEQDTGSPADLNGDGRVNFDDLVTLLAGWGTALGDVNGDGTTDSMDLTIVISAWKANA